MAGDGPPRSSSSACVIAAVGLLITLGRADRTAAGRLHDPARQLLVLLSAGDVDPREHPADAAHDVLRETLSRPSRARAQPMPSIKADRWIRKMALEHGMIEPFEDRQVRDGRHLVRAVVVRLRHPRRRRVQGLHQHQQHGRRSEELRRAVVRRHEDRHLHHPAELVRAGARRSSTSASRATC